MGGVVRAHQCDFMENSSPGGIIAFGQMQAVRLSSIWSCSVWFVQGVKVEDGPVQL